MPMSMSMSISARPGMKESIATVEPRIVPMSTVWGFGRPRWDVGVREYGKKPLRAAIVGPAASGKSTQAWAISVGRCRLNPVEARVERDWSQRLKPKYDDQLSNFAFNFNLRRYISDRFDVPLIYPGDLLRQAAFENPTVGRCRLTVSKSVLKAPMVSALETEV
jgi:hypothetical protein